MAEVLTEFPKKQRGRPEGSVLDPFMDGQIWMLTNEDVPQASSLRSLGNRLRAIASNRGLSTRYSVFENCAVFQALKRPTGTVIFSPNRARQEAAALLASTVRDA